MSNVIAVAIETTGLDPYKDEVVRMSVYGNDGETECDQTFGISPSSTWSKEAQSISGLSPEMVRGLPTFKEVVADGSSDVIKAFNDAEVVVCHNTAFMAGFLGSAGVRLVGKRFGDTGKCFTNYAYSNKLMNVSHTLSMAARCLKVKAPRASHSPDKAKTTYLVWLELIHRRYSRLMSVDELRANFAKRYKKEIQKRKKDRVTEKVKVAEA